MRHTTEVLLALTLQSTRAMTCTIQTCTIQTCYVLRRALTLRTYNVEE